MKQLYPTGLLAILLSLLCLPASAIGTYTGTGILSQGRAETTTSELLKCNAGRGRVAAIGSISDQSGKKRVVPTHNQFKESVKAPDLYNQCNDVRPSGIDEVDSGAIPVTEIDADGEEVTAYIFADNYFELYINGQLVGVDPVPFTPFNSNIVRFRVKKPYEIAVKLVDWEENLGLGTERNLGSDYHPGDGGFIASFSDGTVTSDKWSAQTFYTAPVYDPGCLSEDGESRLSGKCSTEAVDDGEEAYAIHWDVPENWMSPEYDVTDWPAATVFAEEEIGVNTKPAYMNFRDKFTGAGATFIWSKNVVLDNLVLLRYRVG